MSTEMSIERTNLNSKNTNTTDTADNYNSDSNSDFEASVGMSRKWNAREAGREVAENTLKKLNHKPNFFLLFSTIHYEKHGGFQEFLNGVWDVLPKGTPLIGGTVAGFMNPQGCYTRGASALAVYYPRMDVAVGIGKNTKRNPKDAAKKYLDFFKENINQSIFSNSFIFQLTSGPTIPHFPGFGSGFVLKGKVAGSISSNLIETSTKRLQKGIGREEEVLEFISKEMADTKIISGSSTDDMKLAKDFQFFKTEIYSNSVVGINILSDKDFLVRYKHGFSKYSNKLLKVTNMTFGGKIIKKINNSNATEEFFKAINLSPDLFDNDIHRKTFFFPLGFENEDKTISPAAVGAILGTGFSFSFKTKSDELYVLTATGESIVDAIKQSPYKNAKIFFGISCCANLETLGKNVYLVQNEIKKNNDNYLILFTMGEGLYLPDEKISKFFNETNIILSIK